MKVISRSGKAEVLTSPHRPYGNNKVSLEEIRRIREAGGWVCYPLPFFPHFSTSRFVSLSGSLMVANGITILIMLQSIGVKFCFTLLGFLPSPLFGVSSCSQIG